VVSRCLNEEYLIGPFLDYYLSNGADKIIIFDGGSIDRTMEIILARQQIEDKITVVSTNKGYNDELSQTRYNIEIWKYLLDKYVLEDTIAYFIFVDVDEFICCVDIERIEFKQIKHLNQYPSFQIYPSVFIERYPSLDSQLYIQKDFFKKHFISNIDSQFPFGYTQDLWEDVIYKYNVLRISKEDEKNVESIIPNAGFHRWIKDGKLFIEPAPFFLVNHIKVLDWNISVERAEKRLNQITNNQNMCWIHYDYVLNNMKKTRKIISSGCLDGLVITRDFYHDCFERAVKQNRYSGHYNEVVALRYIDEITAMKNNTDYMKNWISDQSYIEGGIIFGEK
jgi:hypothetical protein